MIPLRRNKKSEKGEGDETNPTRRWAHTGTSEARRALSSPCEWPIKYE